MKWLPSRTANYALILSKAVDFNTKRNVAMKTLRVSTKKAEQYFERFKSQLSKSDPKTELPGGFETFLVMLITIVILAVIIINFIICLLVLKR